MAPGLARRGRTPRWPRQWLPRTVSGPQLGGARMEDPYRETANPATLGPNKKHCYACANILDVRAELCPRCGVRQPYLPGMATSNALVPLGERLPAVTTKNRTA